MRTLLISAALLALTSTPAFAAEPCQNIHGRAKMYLGDGQLRIWHIGTGHTFNLGEDEASWKLLGPLMNDPTGMPTNVVFADFLVCPTERFVEGATQAAVVKRIRHPHVLTEERWELP